MTSRLPKLVAFDLEYVVPDDIGKGLVNCIVGCQPHRRYLSMKSMFMLLVLVYSTIIRP